MRSVTTRLRTAQNSEVSWKPFFNVFMGNRNGIKERKLEMTVSCWPCFVILVCISLSLWVRSLCHAATRYSRYVGSCFDAAWAPGISEQSQLLVHCDKCCEITRTWNRTDDRPQLHLFMLIMLRMASGKHLTVQEETSSVFFFSPVTVLASEMSWLCAVECHSLSEIESPFHRSQAHSDFEEMQSEKTGGSCLRDILWHHPVLTRGILGCDALWPAAGKRKYLME